MITQDLVKKLFKYEDGKLIRLISRSGAGKVGAAVGSPNEKGYLLVGIGNLRCRVHRVIFLYHYGHLPEYIDHINGNRTDNRIENLRQCTISENGCNIKARLGCSSKIKGVSWSKDRRLWEAYINLNKPRGANHQSRSIPRHAQ